MRKCKEISEISIIIIIIIIHATMSTKQRQGINAVGGYNLRDCFILMKRTSVRILEYSLSATSNGNFMYSLGISASLTVITS